MKAEAFTYDLGTRIDLSKLEKLNYFRRTDNSDALVTDLKGLTLMVLSNGRIRLFEHERDFEQIRDKMLTASIEIYSIIEDIIKTLGLKVSAKQIISSGRREELGTDDLALFERKQNLSTHVLRSLLFASYDLAGDFQAERISTQAGEQIGRKAVKIKKPQSKEELIRLLKKLFDDLGLGKLSTVEREKGSVTLEAVFRVDDCALCSGVAPVNKKLCNLTRALLRGAFAEFKHMESITANETKCWGMGDTYCEFEVYSLAK